MNADDRRRKIRALRAMAAPDSGATEAERATAARLAGEMESRPVEQPKPAQDFYSIYGAGVTITVKGGSFAFSPMQNVFWNEDGTVR